MPYVIFDSRHNMYVSRSTQRGFSYTNNIDNAMVYKTRGGALKAAGELDTSFKAMGKYPASKSLKLPAYMEIRQVLVTESGVEEKAYGSETDSYGEVQEG